MLHSIYQDRSQTLFCFVSQEKAQNCESHCQAAGSASLNPAMECKEVLSNYTLQGQQARNDQERPESESEQQTENEETN